jgi:tetratricopeptide (TPR) repeat protein
VSSRSPITSSALSTSSKSVFPWQALADLNRALELEPGDAFALAARGDTLRQLGRSEEALADLNRALELKPNNAFALWAHGEALRQLKR